MQPDERDRVRLLHMLEAAEKAVAFSAGREREDLDSDEILALALTRLLEITGEASKGISAGVRESLPDIRWRAIAATRDRLVHGYYEVDLDILWSIITVDLAPLIDSLKQVVGSRGDR